MGTRHKCVIECKKNEPHRTHVGTFNGGWHYTVTMDGDVVVSGDVMVREREQALKFAGHVFGVYLRLQDEEGEGG